MSKLILPKPKPEPPKNARRQLYTFEVSYWSDCLQFINLLDEKNARFLYAAAMTAGVLAHGYVICYEHTEELEMLVLT